MESFTDEEDSIEANVSSMRQELQLGKRTLLMGILNVTRNSSDGGQWFELNKALARADALIEAGADIIDVGGESTRPGSSDVSVEEEIRRVIPVIRAISRQVPVSIDTWKADVAEAALDAGAVIINDIYGFHVDPAMPRLVKEYGAGVILMHNATLYRSGQPDAVKVFTSGKTLPEPVTDVIEKTAGLSTLDAAIACLDQSVRIAREAGIPDASIMVDPGIGFGLSAEENRLLVANLDAFTQWNLPLLLAVSRKRYIAETLSTSDVHRLEAGTAASNAIGILQGADAVRVHDAAYHRPFLDMMDSLLMQRTK